MTEQITKRLHISGLNPSIAASDISARLSHFGTVKSVDGFGLLDRVGQPRKFGFITIETTSGGWKKCLSALSGTTYKGARIRIGEAKPDYTERIAKEKAEASEPPTKKPRLRFSKFSGIEASDMSLITRENASQRPGWKVMPSGRLVRSMKMRPGKPLPPLPSQLKGSKDGKVKKKKVKDPDVRARSRVIDVTKWDGSYITGVFLGGDEVTQVVDGRRAELLIEEDKVVEKEKERKYEKKEKKEKKKEKKQDEAKELFDAENIKSLPDPPVLQSKTLSASATGPPGSSPLDAPEYTDMVAERTQTLALLNSFLFTSSSSGSKSKAANSQVDWDSDVDLDEANVVESSHVAANDVDGGYEIVPQEKNDDKMIVDEEEVHEDNEDEVSREVRMEAEETTPAQPQLPKKSALKDLFAPREDEGGFSLSNHLDLDDDDDLDLDMVPFPSSAPYPQVQTHQVTEPLTLPPAPPTSRTPQSTQPITLDPKKPLFFPRSIALSTSNAATSPFYTHCTPEEIQKRWEENKLELTRGWKKRYREAVKMRRRRGGGVDD